jgi:hypothetical protein
VANPWKSGDILVATETFTCTVDGSPVTVHKGQTRVRAGHPILKGREMWFKVLDVQYDLEQATAAPGEVRGAPASPLPAPRRAAMEAAQATIAAEERAIVEEKKGEG